MMSCTGNKYVKTPAMDSLAKAGVRFEKAYCSNPICVPSRFSMFTGRMPHEIGLKENGFPWDEPRDHFPEPVQKEALGWLIRSAGYETTYGGKVHMPDQISAEQLGFNYICEDEKAELAEACAQYIKEDHNQPFFLVASFINPHDICHMAMDDFAEGWDRTLTLSEYGKKVTALLKPLRTLPDGLSEEEFFEKHCPPLPPNFEPQEDEPYAVQQILEQRLFKKSAREKYTEKQWRMHRWVYAKLTERVDSQIAKVLDAVKKSGIEEETVILFASDHGDMDSAHRLEHKEVLYEESVRVPLIVVPPGRTAARVDRAHVVSTGLDLVPTLCDYAGVQPPEHVTGKSIRPLVEGEAPEKWREFIPVEGTFGDMIVSARWKYMLHNEGAHREQLMDLVNDPYEMRNAASLPENKEILATCRDEFKKHPHVLQKRGFFDCVDLQPKKAE